MRNQDIIQTGNESEQEEQNRYQHHRFFVLSHVSLLIENGEMEEDNIEKRKSEAFIFLNLKHLEAWIKQQERKENATGNQLIIFTQADSSQVFNIYPYLYKDPTTEKIFIIQNVQGGELNRVLNVCLNWQKTSTNLGFNAEPLSQDEDDLNYVIYSISSAQTLIQIEDHSKNLDYFHVIRYMSEGRYGALLSLL